MPKVEPRRTVIKDLAEEIYQVSTALFKILIPVLILVKLLDEAGITLLIAKLLSPLMETIGLPETMGIVVATTIFTNIYTGLSVFMVQGDMSMTVAQASILGCVMLLTHSLIVETAIARQTGIRISVVLITRLGSAFVYALVLHVIYGTLALGQEQAAVVLDMQMQSDPSLSDWLMDTFRNVVFIQLLIIVLLTLLKLLKFLRIDHWLAIAITPLLKMTGISKDAAPLTVIGITLGLSFGGGIIIHETRRGKLSHSDVLLTITLLGILHSIIEDTLLVMLLGGHVAAILLGRFLLAILIVSLLRYLMDITGHKFWYRYLLISKFRTSQGNVKG
jgi:hypothetical protein